MHLVELSTAGLLVGLLVGMTGMGGGALLTPLLVLVFGIDPTTAVGSDLAVSLAVKPVGAAVHQRAGNVRWDIVRHLLPTAIPAAFAGAYSISLLGAHGSAEKVVRSAIGAVLVSGVVAMALQSMIANRRGSASAVVPVRPFLTLLIGLVGGLMVGFTSIGSGSIIIVLLVLAHPGLRPKDLVGTDLVQAIPLVAAALLGHVLFGAVNFGLSAGLLLGAFPGVYLGAKATMRIPAGAMKTALCVVLLASALALWHVPTGLLLVACGTLAAVSGASTLIRRRRGPAVVSAGSPQV